MVRLDRARRLLACDVGRAALSGWHGAVVVVTPRSREESFESVWLAAEDLGWEVATCLGGRPPPVPPAAASPVAMLLSSPDEACSDTLAIERLRRWHPARVVVFLAAGKVPGLGVTALLAGRRWSVIEAA